MTITIELSSPLREKVDLDSPVLDVTHLCTVQDLVRRLAHSNGSAFRQLVLDEANNLHPEVLLSVNDEQIDWGTPRILEEGDTVQIVSSVPDLD